MDMYENKCQPCDLLEVANILTDCGSGVVLSYKICERYADRSSERDSLGAIGAWILNAIAADIANDRFSCVKIGVAGCMVHVSGLREEVCYNKYYKVKVGGETMNNTEWWADVVLCSDLEFE